MKFVAPALGVLVGALVGWGGARYFAPPAPAATQTPSDWVARAGDEYVTADMIRAEMLRRGGMQPGQFQDDEQKRALLDEMLLQRALVDAAKREGLDREAETRRSIEQLLVNQYLRRTLRPEQDKVQVDDAQIQAWFDDHADDYTIPARRRVAMLRMGVAKDADAAAWSKAEARAQEARSKAAALGSDVPHFGTLAREYSDDQATRYRGGVIGWLTEGRAEQYRQDPALLEAAYALKTPGELSPVLRGTDAVYVARLVETQPAQPRALDQLRGGIQQRLTQERYQAIEAEFRRRMLSSANIEVREQALAAIAPPGPPAEDSTPQPPAMPGDQETQP